jgi:hypothetical protein
MSYLSLAEMGSVMGRYLQRNGSQIARRLASLRLLKCLVDRGLLQREILEVETGVSLQRGRRRGGLGTPCSTTAEKVCIFIVKTLMIAYKVSMACTSSQDPGQKGHQELQLSGAPGEDNDLEILVGF